MRPVHPTSLVHRETAQPLLYLALLAGATVALRVALLAGAHLPVCGFRTLTGWPCPFCGGTRCLLALSQFQVGDAFSLNPLVCLASLALLVWAAGLLVPSLRVDEAVRRFWSRTPPAKRWWALGIGVALNWGFLCSQPALGRL